MTNTALPLSFQAATLLICCLARRIFHLSPQQSRLHTAGSLPAGLWDQSVCFAQAIWYMCRRVLAPPQEAHLSTAAVALGAPPDMLSFAEVLVFLYRCSFVPRRCKASLPQHMRCWRLPSPLESSNGSCADAVISSPTWHENREPHIFCECCFTQHLEVSRFLACGAGGCARCRRAYNSCGSCTR